MPLSHHNAKSIKRDVTILIEHYHEPGRHSISDISADYFSNYRFSMEHRPGAFTRVATEHELFGCYFALMLTTATQ